MLCNGFGAVKAVNLRLSHEGNAVVLMESKEAASRAFDRLHNKKWKGMVLKTAFGFKRKKKMPSGKSKAKMKSTKRAFSGGSTMKGSKARLKKKEFEGKGKKKGGLKK